MYRGPYGYGQDFGMFGFPWMSLFFGLVVVALVVAGLVVLIRSTRRGIGQGAPTNGPQHRALEILAERFARGEIDAAAYRSMKAELETAESPSTR